MGNRLAFSAGEGGETASSAGGLSGFPDGGTIAGAWSSSGGDVAGLASVSAGVRCVPELARTRFSAILYVLFDEVAESVKSIRSPASPGGVPKQ